MFKTTASTFFLVVLLLLMGCNPDKTSKSGNNPEATVAPGTDTTAVETATVSQGPFNVETWCNGTLQAGQKAIVPFELQGNLIEVNVRNGQWVTAGQVLAKIDDYRQQQALAQAELNHRQALIDYEDQLLLSGFRTEDSLRVPAKVKSGAMLRSGLSQASLALEKAHRELANTRIIAPVSGTVAGMKAQAYTPTSEYKNFCTLLNTREMQVNFEVLENDATIIKPGVRVQVMPVALPGASFSGLVTGTDPLLSTNGMLGITAKVRNKDSGLIDGMKVKVVISTVIPDQLIVPKSAVLARQNRQVVFTVEEGRAIWNYVTTGYENSTHFTITEGLQAGQIVIVSNNLTIGHQAPVTIANPKP
ncbi:MAG: efflux RND transporter periplasmic adaptor subunit [Lentimicrobium sp.]|jgi:RND family efflux transporter MFP subunit|nr:efflux RND transporter periplasmic adaptor subunit [Lentimicrobium sp.]